MEIGSRVQVVAIESEYFGRYGHVDHITAEGMVVVQLEGETGPLWLWTFHPFALDNAALITWWWDSHPDWIPSRPD